MTSETDAIIQELCRRAVEAKTPSELDAVIPVLRAALERHISVAKQYLRGQREVIASRDVQLQEAQLQKAQLQDDEGQE